jgi:hypothetical protein
MAGGTAAFVSIVLPASCVPIRLYRRKTESLSRTVGCSKTSSACRSSCPVFNQSVARSPDRPPARALRPAPPGAGRRESSGRTRCRLPIASLWTAILVTWVKVLLATTRHMPLASHNVATRPAPDVRVGALRRYLITVTMSRLDTWKAIARYLDRTVRTVQRWERLEGLPVRRHVHRRGASVYASQSEVDEWRRRHESAGGHAGTVSHCPNCGFPISLQTAWESRTLPHQSARSPESD